MTAAVMIFEVSADYLVVLPLLMPTVVSTHVSRSIGRESVDEADFLGVRCWLRGGIHVELLIFRCDETAHTGGGVSGRSIRAST